MAFPLVSGTVLSCTFGAAPSAFAATMIPGAPNPLGPAATIVQTIPNTNIIPFGMCSSLGNPSVASATSAASGTLTPQPCMPVPVTPWLPGVPTQTVAGLPLASTNDKCMCAWGGMISVTAPMCPHYKVGF